MPHDFYDPRTFHFTGSPPQRRASTCKPLRGLFSGQPDDGRLPMSRRRKTRYFAAAGSGATAISNSAAIHAQNGPLHTSAQSLKFLRQNKHNPLPYLQPEMLSRVLESFEHGYFRESCLLWEKMAERDDMIAAVKPKREKDVSQLDMQVISLDETPAAAAHQQLLEKFWRSCRAVNSYDCNERGGFRRLVKQMMSAVSFKYAAHHIIWDPQPDGELRATFEFVPLWLFENTTGKLRYLRSQSALNGEDLADGQWMITTGDGLMIACSIGYLAKRAAMNDWLIFSEKFSVPGVLGRTSAKAGTAEALAMAEATQAFGHDWCAVITGDDGTHAKPIEIIQAAGNPAGMPMPAVIERVDRRIAALYRGADLSSMSSTAGTHGTGASLQEKETDILRRDDAETIAETLAEVSKLVIEWHYGHGTQPLARVELIVPVAEDAGKIITAATALADRGAAISIEALMTRLNLPAASGAADALQAASGTPPVADSAAPPPAIETLENSATGPSIDEGLAEIRAALTADLQPLGAALASALATKDLPAMLAALKKISHRMPELAGESAQLTAVLQDQFTRDFLGGATEEAANGDSPGHPFRGNQWSARPKGDGKPKRPRPVNKISEVLDAAFADPDNRDFTDYQRLGIKEIAAIEARAGRPPAGVVSLTGYRRTLEAEKAMKILSKHATDKYPITEEDFHGLPHALATPTEQKWEAKPGHTPRLVSTIRRGRDLLIVEEIQTGNQRLTVLSMYRP